MQRVLPCKTYLSSIKEVSALFTIFYGLKTSNKKIAYTIIFLYFLRIVQFISNYLMSMLNFIFKARSAECSTSCVIRASAVEKFASLLYRNFHQIKIYKQVYTFGEGKFLNGSILQLFLSVACDFVIKKKCIVLLFHLHRTVSSCQNHTSACNGTY